MIEPAEYKQRLRSLAAQLETDALLVTHLPNVRYLTGFTGSNSVVVLPRSGKAVLLTDPRYTTQAAHEAQCAVRIARGSLLSAAARLIAARKFRRVAFESSHMLFSGWAVLREHAGKSIRMDAVSGLVERQRMVKSEREIELIRRSAEANAKACARALRKLKPGQTTEAELAAEIDYGMRKAGAEGSAFESIVASGEHSALPHARPRRHPVAPGRLLLLDTGALRDGYCSDRTRMAFIGKPDAKSRELFDAVLEAQLAALDAIRPGVRTSAVDAAARKVLKRCGYEKLFVHSTGHGLGLEIHEVPRVGKNDDTRLEAGMAITVEPGAYIEGFGGVRIEDTVVVTQGGCQVLTPDSKELLTL